MKRFKACALILLFFVKGFVVNSANMSGNSGDDYYSGRDSVVTASGMTFLIEERHSLRTGSNDKLVIIKNRDNVLLNDYQIDTGTGEYYTLYKGGFPMAELKPDVLRSIVDSVFSQAEQSYYSSGPRSNRIRLLMAVDPVNRSIVEVKFTIVCHHDDFRLLCVLPDKLALLENQIKQADIVSEMTTWGQPNYVQAYYSLF